MIRSRALPDGWANAPKLRLQKTNRPSGFPEGLGLCHKLESTSQIPYSRVRITLLHASAIRARSDPRNEYNDAPTARPRAVFPESAGHNECTCRTSRSRFDPAPHRSTPAVADHSPTSTPSVPWYKHWPPGPPDPGSPRRRARDYTLRRPAPGLLSLRAGPIICRDKFLISACPFFFLQTPVSSVYFWYFNPRLIVYAR